MHIVYRSSAHSLSKIWVRNYACQVIIQLNMSETNPYPYPSVECPTRLLLVHYEGSCIIVHCTMVVPKTSSPVRDENVPDHHTTPSLHLHQQKQSESTQSIKHPEPKNPRTNLRHTQTPSQMEFTPSIQNERGHKRCQNGSCRSSPFSFVSTVLRAMPARLLNHNIF